MRTLKFQAIYDKTDFKYTFYWAVWSQNIAIVKENKFTGKTSWKVVRNVPLGRDLWRVIHRSASRLGPVSPVCSTSQWNSERIKWVRSQLDPH